MGNRKSCDVRIILAVLLIYVSHAYSQVPKSTVPHNASSFAPKPFRSRQQLKVDSLQAITMPAYAKELHRTKGRSAQNKSVLRIAGCEESYLCVARSLPVSLIYFSGLRLNASEVRLQWETASEQSNSGFEVERSIAGTGDYRVIARLDGSGNSVKVKKYVTIDPNTDSDISYYRLKQIDLDGTYTYSNVVGVQGFKELLSVLALPNPAKQSELFFQLSGAALKTVDLAIYSVSGAVVYRNKSYNPESNGRIPLKSLARLNSGAYVIKVLSGEDDATTSFVVIN